MGFLGSLTGSVHRNEADTGMGQLIQCLSLDNLAQYAAALKAEGNQFAGVSVPTNR